MVFIHGEQMRYHASSTKHQESARFRNANGLTGKNLEDVPRGDDNEIEPRTQGT